MQHLNVITLGQLCERVGVSRSTIKRGIQTRNFPQPLKASGHESLFNLRCLGLDVGGTLMKSTGLGDSIKLHS